MCYVTHSQGPFITKKRIWFFIFFVSFIWLFFRQTMQQQVVIEENNVHAPAKTYYTTGSNSGKAVNRLRTLSVKYHFLLLSLFYGDDKLILQFVNREDMKYLNWEK
jgi:hypothetical protein